MDRVRYLLQTARRRAYRRRLTKNIPHKDWQREIAANHLPTESVSLREQGSVYFSTLDLTLPAHPVAYELVKSHQMLQELFEKTVARAHWEQHLEELVIRFNTEIYPVRLSEEVYILHEFLVRGDYNLRVQQPALIFDVGANVGFASIFLASRNPDAMIYAYEPLIDNYQRAQRNINLNPQLADRIKLHPYGLYSDDADLEMQSEVLNPGRSSVVIDREKSPSSEITLHRVQMREAAIELRSVIARHQDRVVWVKLDCEGSEYEILKNMSSARLFSEIKGFLFEWHRIETSDEPMEAIEKILSPHGFTVHTRSGFDVKAMDGMCIAVR